MTQLQVPEKPPSWLMPIAVTAMATVLVQGLPLVASSAMPQLGCPMTCFCGIGWLPIGVLAALLVLQRDALMTPGQGFAVSFIAAGLGSVFTAFYFVLQIKSVDPETRRQEMRELVEQQNEQMKLSQDQIDQAVAGLTELVPYVPVVMAVVYTALAGVTGLLTVLVLRRRAALPPALPPPTL